MPSFNTLTERPPAEVAAATEAAHRIPIDTALVCHRQQQQFRHIATTSRNHREELAAMLQELQANRGILDGLARWYGLFVFTGGDVPTAQWNLAAITAYLEHPSTTNCLPTSELQHYQQRIQTIRELGTPGTGLTTLRYRHDLGEKFNQAASKVRVLADALESSVTKAMEDLPAPSV
jgi:hypothetical protein